MSPDVYLNPEDNLEYGEINESFNDLHKQIARIQKELQSFRVPKIWSFGAFGALKKIGRRLHPLQSKANQRRQRALDFYLNHRYTIPPDADRALTIIRFQQVLLYRIHQSEDSTMRIVENFNRIASQLKDQRNLTIAITSPIMGLIVSSLQFL